MPLGRGHVLMFTEHGGHIARRLERARHVAPVQTKSIVDSPCECALVRRGGACTTFFETQQTRGGWSSVREVSVTGCLYCSTGAETHPYTTLNPPSITRACPFKYEDRSEHSQATASATSRGSIRRLSG